MGAIEGDGLAHGLRRDKGTDLGLIWVSGLGYSPVAKGRQQCGGRVKEKGVWQGNNGQSREEGKMPVGIMQGKCELRTLPSLQVSYCWSKH